MKKLIIERLHFPVDGYQFIVKTLVSVDGGQMYYYCGSSRYFKTYTEAVKYKREAGE